MLSSNPVLQVKDSSGSVTKTNLVLECSFPALTGVSNPAYQVQWYMGRDKDPIHSEWLSVDPGELSLSAVITVTQMLGRNMQEGVCTIH